MNTIRGGQGTDDPEHVRRRGVSPLGLIQRAYDVLMMNRIEKKPAEN
jgi:hypothetical protein